VNYSLIIKNNGIQIIHLMLILNEMLSYCRLKGGEFKKFFPVTSDKKIYCTVAKNTISIKKYNFILNMRILHLFCFLFLINKK